MAISCVKVGVIPACVAKIRIACFSLPKVNNNVKGETVLNPVHIPHAIPNTHNNNVKGETLLTPYIFPMQYLIHIPIM